MYKGSGSQRPIAHIGRYLRTCSKPEASCKLRLSKPSETYAKNLWKPSAGPTAKPSASWETFLQKLSHQETFLPQNLSRNLPPEPSASRNLSSTNLPRNLHHHDLTTFLLLSMKASYSVPPAAQLLRSCLYIVV